MMTFSICERARTLLAGRIILLVLVAAGWTQCGVAAHSSERHVDHDHQTQPTSHTQTVQTENAKIAKRSVRLKSTRSHSGQSTLARAAHGELTSLPPTAPLDAAISERQIKQVGFLHHGCDNGCGPVCDCDLVGIVNEVSCGVEPGCGIDGEFVAIEPSCGVAGCNRCGEATCGVESVFAEPVCGAESGVPCDCDSCAVGHGRVLTRLADVPLFLPLLKVRWNRFQFFAGTQGFKGPLNFAGIDPANAAVRSGSGSFGFYQGFNESRSLKPLLGWDIAAQFGARVTQSNLSGAQFTEETRHQVFVTGGFFRRVDYGLQLGGVLDYLNDDWYFQSDLLQIRAEFSWKTQSAGVFGFQFTSSLGPDSSTTALRDSTGAIFNGNIEFEPTDQYRFFYRSLLNGGGDWTAFGGFTEEDDGLVGLTINLPIRKKLVLGTGATFLVPREGDESGGSQEEGWNVSLGLTFRPGGPRGAGRYTRPLFDVADNGTFLVDFQ